MCLFFFVFCMDRGAFNRWNGGGGVVYGSKHVRASFVTNAGSSFYSK